MNDEVKKGYIETQLAGPVKRLGIPLVRTIDETVQTVLDELAQQSPDSACTLFDKLCPALKQLQLLVNTTCGDRTGFALIDDIHGTACPAVSLGTSDKPCDQYFNEEITAGMYVHWRIHEEVQLTADEFTVIRRSESSQVSAVVFHTSKTPSAIGHQIRTALRRLTDVAVEVEVRRLLLLWVNSQVAKSGYFVHPDAIKGMDEHGVPNWTHAADTRWLAQNGFLVQRLHRSPS